ncbi:SipA3 protein [Uncinocarpus reesii 1704]|uniref:SipA3 protein n=1 Tax=Uncinocarpus reesii (strain UAMH 1704) TaxID=336963 RepID=C4JK54_UNCRE|nr:SipA3 protein [Uncinocarpus reesii 1704]EEP77162.1 SipA3 protein [Uncinocarpus reesii 1704]
MSPTPQFSVPKVGGIVNVIPVGLKEAALDSPSFRSSAVHFCDQLDYVEKWLEGYVKATGKLTSEVSSLEAITSSFISYANSPLNVSEAVLDHDYAMLAMKRYGETSRGLTNVKWLQETRRILDQTQKQYDHLQSRYSSQTKSKEPSSLREDAFQLHEARKAYLKASMDFCIQYPQLKVTLEKLLVQVSFGQWREFKVARDNSMLLFAKHGKEMDRIKGWTHEMEISEKSSRREIIAARKQIEDSAEYAARPSRELEDYSVSTVPFLGSQGAASLSKMAKDHKFSPEKQGWLSLRILTGKPTRTVWARRWAFLKNGIFGCLVQGSRTGGVEESERIGVLLCSIRPAFQEERRFCFEVKTKSNTIMLQAETQKELTEWIGSFEAAKRKALENPSQEFLPSAKVPAQDPAFAISQPPAPEFTADISESLTPNANEEHTGSERSATLPVDRDGLGVRNSGDFTHSRRSTAFDREGDGGRDHTPRIIQKLDIRKGNSASHTGSASPQSGSGISSLISASHHLLPSMSTSNVETESSKSKSMGPTPFRDIPTTTLAPPTLVSPPNPTNMSRAAVSVSVERGIGVGLADSTGNVPSGMMANLWGSSNWALVNKLEREASQKLANGIDEYKSYNGSSNDPSTPTGHSPVSRHRQTVSLGGADALQQKPQPRHHEYPNYYPSLLKPQDAQFRLLFPEVAGDEPLVLVFRATFSPNDQHDFPGRVYATTKSLYFYSSYFGLVLTSSANLSSITEVTAASGRDCDFLYLHIIPEKGSDIPGRLTIKTFLEPLRLLQRRLNFLVNNATSEEPATLETVLKTLIRMEQEGPTRNPSMDSWEDMSLSNSAEGSGVGKAEKLLKPGIYVDKTLEVDQGDSKQYVDAPRFRLPAQPVEYVPQGRLYPSAEKYFDISPKALFHVLFGDKSPVWQFLQLQRRAQNIEQSVWSNAESAHMRRHFEYQIEVADFFGRPHLTRVSDYQIVDVLNDHLCYVITDKRTPWHLPFKGQFQLVGKVVITHVAKSRCKLAIFTKVDWLSKPYLMQSIIEREAMKDLEQDALDLIDLASDQVKKLGHHHITKKAVSMFGNIGQETQAFKLTSDSLALNPRSQVRRPLRQSGLLPLLLETTGSFLQSAISSLMIWFWALLRWIWKTSNANRVILSLLICSVVFNGFYSYRDTFDWWHERNASNFMARLGVRPNNILTKAVYVKDIDNAIVNDGGVQSNTSSCISREQPTYSERWRPCPYGHTQESKQPSISFSAYKAKTGLVPPRSSCSVEGCQ